MKITLEIDDSIVEGLRKEQQAKIDAEPDELEKAKLKIWSIEELLTAHLQTLALFYHEGKLFPKSLP